MNIPLSSGQNWFKENTETKWSYPSKTDEGFPYYVLSQEITNLFSYFIIRMDGGLRFL